MFNMSSPQAQVSNFIENNAVLLKLKLTFKFRSTLQCYKFKIKYKFYNPFTNAFLT